jgi:hypothetical protein
MPPNVNLQKSEAFYSCPYAVIYGNEGSFAETYAMEWEIPFVSYIFD